MQQKKSLWYRDAIFYEVNVRAFYDSNGDGIGDLKGLEERFEYIAELGIDCVWLMPIYPSPLNDDGYDIADYYGVHPDLGTLENFKDVVETAHRWGIRVIIDLVLNHTSDQHHWFQEARKDRDSKYRDYYVWSDTDQKYTDTRIIFLDVEESNWTWDEVAEQYFWHRFYSSQPDLNFDNPAVREEMFRVAKFWLDLGVDGFRADAVPYLFEREGTNCENLPETHAYLKELRSFIEQHYPEAILLCEANQWPQDLRTYFGDGDEFHMGFHFPLMPRVFMALEKGTVTKIKEILDETPEIPENCHWCTFLRNHDELTLEMVTEAERAWMWEQYAPEPRMKLNLGIRRRLAPLLDNNEQKIGLANSLLFTLPGTPIIYYGDEIGMGDNIWLDDRNGVRTPMQWDDTKNAGFSTAPSEQLFLPVVAHEDYSLSKVNVAAQKADQESLFNRVLRMVQLRKSFAALSGGDFSWADTAGNENVAAYYRVTDKQRILIVNNLLNKSQRVSLLIEDAQFLKDVLTDKKILIEQGHISLKLKPYQYAWCIIEN